MREQKFHIYLDSHERTILLHSLVELKNQLLAQGRHSMMLGSIYPAAVSGRRTLWCWDVPHTSGSTSHVCLAGRSAENISGILTGNRPLSGNMTGRSPARNIRP